MLLNFFSSFVQSKEDIKDKDKKKQKLKPVIQKKI